MTGTTSGRAKSAPASGAASTVTAATPRPVTGVLQAMVAADSRTRSFRATNAGRSPESWNGPTKASRRLAIATSPKSCGESTRASSRLVAIAISWVGAEGEGDPRGAAGGPAAERGSGSYLGGEGTARRRGGREQSPAGGTSQNSGAVDR